MWVRRYTEIKTAQVNHLLAIWLSGSGEEPETVREKLDEKIDSYAAGELEHAVDVISSIWKISNQDKPVPSDPTSHPPPFLRSSHADTGCNGSTAGQRDDMQYSLIKSIQKGHLLDRKYWARRSREGALEPIYFSSTVARDKLSRLDSRE